MNGTGGSNGNGTGGSNGGSSAPLLVTGSFADMSDDDREKLRQIQVGHNLSSVVNNPGSATESAGWFGSLSTMFQRDDFESNLPIPSVIQPVQLSDFDSYLEANMKCVRRFYRNHHIPPPAPANSNRLNRSRRRSSIEEGELQSESVRRTRYFAKGLAAVGQDGNLAGASNDANRISSLSNEALQVCFQKVPSKYFELDYVVSFEEEQDDSHAAYLLQEKLSNWLDLVEICLWSQTTSQAQQFFGALSDLNNLNVQVRDGCDNIANLRKHIRNAQETLVNRHLEVLQKKRKKANLLCLQELMVKIRDVRQTIPDVDNLLATSHYSAALTSISNAKAVLNNELSGVHSLRTLMRQLNDYESMIFEQLSNKFVDLVVTWDVDDDEAESENVSEFQHEQLFGKMLPLVVGLLSTQKKQVDGVMIEYRNRVTKEARESADYAFIEALSEIGKEKSTNDENGANGTNRNLVDIPSKVKGLSPDEFHVFLGPVFDSLESVVSRAHLVNKTFQECLDRFKEDQENVEGCTSRTIERLASLKAESENTLNWVTQQAQEKVKWVLDLRQELHSKLQLNEFKLVFDKVGRFAMRLERLTKQSNGAILRGALKNQATSVVRTTHKECIGVIKASLEDEEWKQVDVPYDLQAIVKRLQSGHLSPTRNRDYGDDSNGASSTPQPVIKLANGKKRSAKNRDMVVSGRTYRAVSSVLLLVDFLEIYLSCAQQLGLWSYCLPHISELLRVFNERSKELVLGHKTQKLARISTKNLALASQALSIVLALEPYMRKLLLGCLSTNSHYKKNASRIEVELDTVSNEYKAHRHEIFAKFTELVERLLEECCQNRMNKVDWDARNSTNLGKPHDYMTELTEKTKTVFVLLNRYLSSDQVQMVFEDIFSLFNRRIPELYAVVEPKTPTGRSRVRIDINHLISSLRRLRGLKGLGDSLEKFVMQKYSNTSLQNKKKSDGSTAAGETEEGEPTNGDSTNEQPANVDQELLGSAGGEEGGDDTPNENANNEQQVTQQDTGVQEHAQNGDQDEITLPKEDVVNQEQVQSEDETQLDEDAVDQEQVQSGDQGEITQLKGDAVDQGLVQSDDQGEIQQLQNDIVDHETEDKGEVRHLQESQEDDDANDGEYDTEL
mmetsp:Transcript_33210/g.53476  ORF Transcript_33210/g.53476 Transcript_33210/m.53476 type:complete len:1127 (+) Transcript_33210:408-3788(+)|eukprot:CAMPEP_0203757728 /NCGR_PEP_ID=MMETSP0098-20131031/10656_1 /ASSEMBLY_ACC=CAM_ASM_000208 /TAXON_ID=96639 /ORGANISM=" , Strain NY0313808BC1" /LENGTH=1126 /DNA_ID=CAMNT_0050649957 /DNA_START=285 /DNA_END=3665 /DNA_ORIENTATION=+